MPTVGIYIPIHTARTLAAKYDVQPNEERFREVVRNIAAKALDLEAEISHEQRPFVADCPNVWLHAPRRRCRLCGGS